MTRLRLLLLAKDERAALRYLGRVGVIHLVRTVAGPDSAPLTPRDRHEESIRWERLAARVENLRRTHNLRRLETTLNPSNFSLRQAEDALQSFEKQSRELMERRRLVEQQLAETAAVSEQISDYRDLDLPLDEPGEPAFLHFVTGSLPAKNLGRLKFGNDVALLPLAEHNGQETIIAITLRRNRRELEGLLANAGFRPQPLPRRRGATTAGLATANQQEQQQAAAQLTALDAQLHSLAESIAPVCAQLERAVGIEQRLLEAEQNFPRTESSVLVTGWVPAAEAPDLKRRLCEITRGRCVIESFPAEASDAGEVPVLLRPSRWLRPFAGLVTAYGLPRYHELEPTLFVALSYLLMFGMMFGDVGHGFILAVAGLVLWLGRRKGTLHDAGLLLSLAGGSSMIFGVLYGSCFGLEAFKKYALWHDPLAGDPMSMMFIAVGIGITVISLGLVLNIINRLRHGDFIGAFLDKFGISGALFYWIALVTIVKFAAMRAHGLLTPAILLLAIIVIGWMLNEPLQVWRQRRAEARDKLAVAMESLASAFEGLLSYFANTISFVRLAAYAISHAALLLATFLIADNVKHLFVGGGFLAVLVIILGNVVAMALEGIVASVQALRLEYYEFFGKFFAGGGRPFQPFRLQTNPVADAT